MSSNVRKAKNPFEEPVDPFVECDQGKRRLILPVLGERCEFVMKECFVAENKIPKGFHVYGYCYSHDAVYLPAFRAKMSATLVEKWRYVKEQKYPLYWNGSGRSQFECFEEH